LAEKCLFTALVEAYYQDTLEPERAKELVGMYEVDYYSDLDARNGEIEREFLDLDTDKPVQ